MHRPAKYDPAWIDFFSNPCPYMAKQLTTFPQFPRFPKELQLRVWELSLPDARCIFVDEITYTKQVSTEDDDGDNNADNGDEEPEEFTRCSVKTRVPAVLQACFLSRQVALKTYRLAFDGPLRFPIYFDFERDLLRFSSVQTLLTFQEGSDDSEEVEDDFSSLKFTWLVKHGRFNEDDLVKACAVFPRLRHIIESHDDSRPRPHALASARNTPSIIPETYHPEDNTNNWTNLQPFIEADGDFFNRGITNWQAPVFTLGSHEQWARAWQDGMFHVDWDIDSHGKKGRMVRSVGVPMEWEVNAVIPSLDFFPQYGRGGRV